MRAGLALFCLLAMTGAAPAIAAKCADTSGFETVQQTVDAAVPCEGPRKRYVKNAKRVVKTAGLSKACREKFVKERIEQSTCGRSGVICCQRKGKRVGSYKAMPKQCKGAGVICTVAPSVGAACGPAGECVTTTTTTTTTSTTSTTAPTATTVPIVTTTISTPATTTTTIPVPLGCGNGVVEAGEECDDANPDGCDGCTACRIDRCGDGILCTNTGLGEQCDDGNLTSGDGCNQRCETEGSTCTNPPIGTRLVVVNVTTPSPLAGIQITLEYPQLQSSIPGSGISALVNDRVFAFPEPAAGSPFVLTSDNDVAVSTVIAAAGPPGSEFIRTGPLVAYSFDNCVPVDQGVCNRAQTVVGCCNDPSDPNQFNDPNVCTGTTPQVACPGGLDTECPPRAAGACTGAGTPYACCTGVGSGSCDSTACTGPAMPFGCCTGAGTGNCEAIQLGCTANSQPFACCTGSGTGTCPVPTKGSCSVRCPSNPPVCAINASTGGANFSPTVVGPCQGQVCSNAATRSCVVDADCAAPGVCTGVQQSGACPGDNECKPQSALTACFVTSPVNALGQPVSGVSCSVAIL